MKYLPSAVSSTRFNTSITSVPAARGLNISTAITKADTSILGFISSRSLATFSRMAHLSTVPTLDLAPVLGLWAVAREMANLFAVVTGYSIRITRLVTLLNHVLGGSTVAARLRRALFDIRAVPREVAHLIAFPTFDIIGGPRLWTLLCNMTFLLAILACEGVDALLGAIAGSVTDLLTIDALDSWGSVLALRDLFLAVFTNVAKLCIRLAIPNSIQSSVYE